MNNSRTPDQLTRLVARAIVGGATAFVIKKAFPTATFSVQLIGMFGTIVAHEHFDAPIAGWLASSTPL